ncbi:sensor histidine kinase [Proteiniclasticum ruminis]|uniref:histidine kinase n=1 Tax=Proteiniclasticum ruminis TaxID=398199 RepID=A0A1I4ZUU2_9CLOT|nr:HAMP domain-containing sensor histidine kinase [Proteiniclasticum ruminis]SFN53927.1 His Kinase A (phospho-acceptor) domain-containing protein [Proteiniclasticum ruminis]
MMRIFRNKEIRLLFLFQSVLLLAFLSFHVLFEENTVLILALYGAASMMFYLYFTKRRYQKIDLLTKEVDQVLFQDQFTPISQYEEGELSILRTQIHKMNLKLQENQSALQKEKVHLVESLQDISHQVRTPLTTLFLLAERLKEEDLPAHRRRSLLQEEVRHLRQIDWLIGSLLKMAKLDADTAVFEEKNVQVEELLLKALDPLRIPLELRNQEVVLHLEPGASFLGDLSWSAEAVTNLLKNAMEHMEPGKKIIVEARENVLFTEVVQKDEGPGIPEEDLPHLFERFYKGKNAKENSVGIGLALSRMILTKQKGTLKAENALEGGAKFTLRIYKS